MRVQSLYLASHLLTSYIRRDFHMAYSADMPINPFRSGRGI
jgi:hypothetical protein